MHDINTQFESANSIGNLMTKQEGIYMLVIETNNMKSTKKAHSPVVVCRIKMIFGLF